MLLETFHRTISEIYPQYENELKALFPTLEDALEAERRSLDEGDDRADLMLAEAYRTPVIKEKVKARENSEGRYFYIDYISQEKSYFFLKRAQEKGNPDAFEFKESIKLGNRRATLNRPVHFYLPNADRFVEKNAPKTILDPYKFDASDKIKHYADVEWRSLKLANKDKPRPSTLRYIGMKAAHMFKAYDEAEIYILLKELKDEVIPALEICAKAGDIISLANLQNFFSKENFNICRPTIFENYRSHFIPNVIKDPKRMYELKSIYKVDLVAEGEIPADDIKDFENFFLNQTHDNPDDLYNLGIALLDENLFEKQTERALNFLKHAANNGNGNAAKKLGDYYLASAETGLLEDFGKAKIWYKLADQNGHPNGKARVQWLEKTKSSHFYFPINELELRNPSPEYAKLHPEAMVGIKIPDVNYSFLRDTTQGTLENRIEKALKISEEQLLAFNDILFVINSKLEAIRTLESSKKEEVSLNQQKIMRGFDENARLDTQKEFHRRLVKLSFDRWKKEQAASVGLSVAFGVGRLTFGDPTALSSVFRSLTRAGGAYAAMQNEIDFREEIISQLNIKQVNIPLYENKIQELVDSIKRFAESKVVGELRKNQIHQTRLIHGYLRSQLLYQGYDNLQNLKEYLDNFGISDIEDFITEFDHPLAQSLENFCLGVADTADINIIFSYCALKSHQRSNNNNDHALCGFVEDIIKANVADYLPKASRIDVIMENGFSFSSEALVEKPSGNQKLPNSETSEPQIALAGLMGNNFSTVGSLNIDELFSFYLHRHGNKFLRDTRVNDGQVSNQIKDKSIETFTEDELEEFVERVKHSFRVGSTALPKIDHLFLRVCAHEYFMPQAVKTSGTATFANNPEAPVSYPMINEVIHSFIEKMSLSPIAGYRQKVGKRLDNLIAQSFIDFFAVLGRKHSVDFHQERLNMRTAYDVGTYSTNFDRILRKIIKDGVSRFDLFKKIYAINLDKSLQVNLEKDNARLMQEISALKILGIEVLEQPEISVANSIVAYKQAKSNNASLENLGMKLWELE